MPLSHVELTLVADLLLFVCVLLLIWALWRDRADTRRFKQLAIRTQEVTLGCYRRELLLTKILIRLQGESSEVQGQEASCEPGNPSCAGNNEDPPFPQAETGLCKCRGGQKCHHGTDA